MGKKRPKIMSKSSVSFNWNKLPEHIFGYIKMRIGLESMDNLLYIYADKFAKAGMR